jgi:hypothetical protein
MEKYKFRLYISVYSSAGAVIKKFTIETNTKDEAERKGMDRRKSHERGCYKIS